jgi:threonine synthase
MTNVSWKQKMPISAISKNNPTAAGISHLSDLQCSGCGKTYSSRQIHTYCPECQSTLLAQYNLNTTRQHVDRDEIIRRSPGMWRWHEVLPVGDPANQVTLGEGDTSLLSLPRLGKTLGLNHLFVKEESSNPTGSFKARGLSAAVSKAKELGIKKVIIPTAGNAGGAMAAYAARAGMKSMIYMPKDTPHANIEESRIVGAEVILIDGLISDAAGMAGVKAREEGWFDVSTFKEPYRTEGKKIMGYELAEQFKWDLPDVIIYPTGGGTGLVGMWKAFQEMEELGWLETKKRPRMVAVQAAGCAPVPLAFQKKAEFCDFWTDAHTVASGLRVPKSFADHLILHDIYESNGTAIAVEDAELLKAQKELAIAEGVFAAPEGAATLAALKELVAQNWVHPDEKIVLFNTGSGLKYLDKQ